MKRSILPFLAALAAAPASAQPASAPAAPAPNYASAGLWLCLPGRADVCSEPLPTTALTPNGYGPAGRSNVAEAPPIDCFYVYPTVSRDEGLNSDLMPNAAERSIAQRQFGRFASACRTFAPVYRQMTVGAITAAAAGVDLRAPGELAYKDVAAAWRAYLQRHNQGRPFVLIGHSQGSLMLQELIKHEIEGKPIARQMLRAIIPGFNVLVPEGKVVGGTFRTTPVCTSPGQTGCVMSWVSYREGNIPPQGAMFGFAPAAGMTVACTNPARPGSRNWERLDSYWHSRSDSSAPGGAVRWSTQGPPPTIYLRTEGLVSARCAQAGQRGYLSVRINADPRDRRTDRIGGEVGALGFYLPGWGMHLADMAIAQGDLVRQVEALAASRR